MKHRVRCPFGRGAKCGEFERQRRRRSPAFDCLARVLPFVSSVWVAAQRINRAGGTVVGVRGGALWSPRYWWYSRCTARCYALRC